MNQSSRPQESHFVPMGYLYWIFGFMGSHRFYYGKPKTGTLWFCTLGLLGIGWMIDLFLIPSMDREANLSYVEGPKNYTVGWILLTFFGTFGFHRFYLGKWVTGMIWLLTGALLGVGLLRDFWTFNEQIAEVNRGYTRV